MINYFTYFKRMKIWTVMVGILVVVVIITFFQFNAL